MAVVDTGKAVGAGDGGGGGGTGQARGRLLGVGGSRTVSLVSLRGCWDWKAGWK